VARDEPIVRPARTDEWQVVAADKGVVEDWDRWAKQEPSALKARPHPDVRRWYRSYWLTWRRGRLRRRFLPAPTETTRVGAAAG
jgi:hypothetical protein